MSPMNTAKRLQIIAQGFNPGWAVVTERALTRRFVLVLVLESGRAECWSIGVLRQVRIAPRVRGVGDAERAVESGASRLQSLTKQTADRKYLSPLQGGSSCGCVPGVKTPG